MNIKHIAVIAAISCAVIGAYAEGYQINTLSARQNGMGHTGTALHLGSESMIFNPAGMAGMKDNIDFSGSVTAIFPHVSADYEGVNYATSNGASTPMAFNLAMKVYRNLAAGVSFYTPYGSAINWGENWPGAVLNQKVNLKVFTVQPTLSWEIIPGLSVGAGAMVSWGTVDLYKGLVSSQSVNALLAATGNPYRFSDTPASVNLRGKAAVTVGVNVGIMWDINSKITVGASFRQKMKMKVKSGDASVTYANDVARGILMEQLDLINQANFEAEMPAPAILNLGVAYKPVGRLTLAFDAQWTFWSAYKNLDIHFLSNHLRPFDQHLRKDYRNSWTFHLGAQYALTKRFDLRAGLMVDTTPVRIDCFNPETPGMTKISPSVGFSFYPLKNFSIDAALLYVAGLGRDGASCSYNDLLLQFQGLPESVYSKTFTADYHVHAWNPSIGVTLRF